MPVASADGIRLEVAWCDVPTSDVHPPMARIQSRIAESRAYADRRPILAGLSCWPIL